MSDNLDKWRQQLSEEQFQVCRMKGTERPFTGKYYKHDAEGTYVCVCCGEPLFDSSTKYESGSGWPSFWAADNENAIEEQVDSSHGMTRTEIMCRKCGSHLGHVFPDGPAPSGLRYCVNSLSLDFVPQSSED